MCFRRTCKLVELENATKALEKAKPKNQETVRFWQTHALHVIRILLVPPFCFVAHDWVFAFTWFTEGCSILLAIELKVKSSFWTIIVNATIKECQIVSCIFFFIIEIQKAKDDAEEAYNSISEVAKKEVNKMIYKSLLMILDIWNSYICIAVKKWKNSGLYGIWIHDLCDTGVALYQLS